MEASTIDQHFHLYVILYSCAHYQEQNTGQSYWHRLFIGIDHLANCHLCRGICLIIALRSFIRETILKYPFILTLWVIILITSCEPSNSLIGDYTLLIIEEQDSSGTWNQSEWMKGATGSLSYSADGFMSVKFTPENEENAPYWYKASYVYHSHSNEVIHTRLEHSDPEEIGKTVKRKLTFKQDTLIMHAEEFGLRLKWLRWSQ